MIITSRCGKPGLLLLACAALLLLLPAPCTALALNAPAPYGAHGPQGYLGIDVRDVPEESVSVLRLHDTRGAEIIRVDHDGPAGRLGLREHDVVLQMNNTAIEGQDHLRRMLRESAPGMNVTLLISRDGQQITMQTQMADRGDVERRAWELHLNPGAPMSGPQAPATGLPTGEASTALNSPVPAPSSRYSKSFLGSLLPSPSYTGAMLESMTSQLAEFIGVPHGVGLFVRRVIPNSPADMAGLKPGDIVTRANLQPVGSPSKWARTVKDAQGKPVTLTILRDKQEHTLTLVPDSRKHSCLELPAGPGGYGVMIASPPRPSTL